MVLQSSIYCHRYHGFCILKLWQYRAGGPGASVVAEEDGQHSTCRDPAVLLLVVTDICSYVPRIFIPVYMCSQTCASMGMPERIREHMCTCIFCTLYVRVPFMAIYTHTFHNIRVHAFANEF